MIDCKSISPSSAPLGSSLYWNERARRYAGAGAGLGAVCSFGMPAFYNRSIHLCQLLALRPWLRVPVDTPVLDIGCGIGRWSRRLAVRGARVTGVDVSAAMIDEAQRRAAQQGLTERCRFLVEDVSEFDLRQRYPLVLGVTVLQHIQDEKRLAAAVANIAAHLASGGRAVLLEAAPSRPVSRCDSPIFTARTQRAYQALFAASGLGIEAVTGVDPVPLKTAFLPYYRRLPRALALGALASITAVSTPLDAVFGRRCVEESWHKLFVLRHCHDRRSV